MAWRTAEMLSATASTRPDPTSAATSSATTSSMAGVDEHQLDLPAADAAAGVELLGGELAEGEAGRAIDPGRPLEGYGEGHRGDARLGGVGRDRSRGSPPAGSGARGRASDRRGYDRFGTSPGHALAQT